jgi:hypothetical protein
VTSGNATLTLDDVPARFRANDSTAFDHEQCMARILAYTAETIPVNIFVNDANTRERMVIWMPACEAFCGKGVRLPFHGWYPDSGPRIMS